MEEVKPQIQYMQEARNALAMFKLATTPEEKCDLSDEFEEAIAQVNFERGSIDETAYRIINREAMTLFLDEIQKTDDNDLKEALADELSLRIFHVAADEDFYHNATSIFLQTAKNAKDEPTANYIYSQIRFMFGEDNNRPIKNKEAEFLGAAILNNLNPSMKNQIEQAYLLNQYNINSSNYYTQAMSKRADELLKEYYTNTIEEITSNSSKEDKENCWAQYYIRAELAKIALNNSYNLDMLS